MQRHLDRPEEPVLVLSKEEQAILTDEQNETVQGIEDDVAVGARVGDTDAILSDAESVLAQAPEVGDVEQQLAASVADMAVAGTDADAEALVPEAPVVSAEGFTDDVMKHLQKLWDKIKKFFDAIWNKLKAFFSRIAAFFNGTELKGKALEEQLKREESLAKDVQAALTKGKTQVSNGAKQNNAEATPTTPDHDPQANKQITQKGAQEPFTFLGSELLITLGPGKPVLKPAEYTDVFGRTRNFMQDALYGITEESFNQFDVLIKIAEAVKHQPKNWREIFAREGRNWTRSQEKMLKGLGIDPQGGPNSDNRQHYLGGLQVKGGYTNPNQKDTSTQGEEWRNEFKEFSLSFERHIKGGGFVESAEPLTHDQCKKIRQTQSSWSAIAKHRDTLNDLQDLEKRKDRLETALAAIAHLKPSAIDFDADSAEDIVGKLTEVDLGYGYNHLINAARQVTNQVAVLATLMQHVEQAMRNGVDYASASTTWRMDHNSGK